MKFKEQAIEKTTLILQELIKYIDSALIKLSPWHKETLYKMLEDLKKTSIRLNDRTVVSTLEEWVDNFKQRHSAMGMVVTYNELGMRVSIPRALQHELTCVLQEACRNAVKHGKAGMIQILTVFQDDSLKITIADNGEGIDVDQLNNREECGAGVSNMQFRISMLGGTIELADRVGEPGAVVIVDVPLGGSEIEKGLNYTEILGKELHDILCPEIIGVSMIVSNYKKSLTENEAEQWYVLQCVEQELSDYASRSRALSHVLLA